MKYNWWIEIQSQAGKLYKSTRAFRGTEEQVRRFVESQKQTLHGKGHVNVSARYYRIDTMTYMGEIR